MRYSEFSVVPTSSMEAYNSIIDIITVYMSKNRKYIPMDIIMSILHNQGYDITPRMVMDYLETNDNVENVTSTKIYLKNDDADMGMIPKNKKEDAGNHIKDMADSEIGSDDETKNIKHVKKLAKRAIGKS